MFPFILFLFIAVPIIEIGLFIQVGGFLGLWPTIGLVLITAFVGASLVRSQGLQTLLTMQQRLQDGELPAQQILEGVLLAVAGVLLLTPGFLTDLMGMVVLLPGPRALLARKLMDKVSVQGNFQQPFGPGEHETSHHRGNTYEGEFDRKDNHDKHDKLN
ncbi:FxsA family protein [Vibrio mangrovi]|uniref:FxsA family protein n=1 Tax=Vibrio mangrovi TaxID=474394 RepID=A0A1Y6J3G5_9VIBR|nr:FxsA family protein [Vibrio mangrovi]MDW6002683.1 FxsA family protein [Vibrio mangrovi]SMS02843.1 phage T7 F exclusion suppressor FxsA [Vibrio mangrovi]